jgi:hypothetical protein
MVSIAPAARAFSVFVEKTADRMKPNQARSGKLASGIFLIVGLGLLAGAGIAYFYVVERPKAWELAATFVNLLAPAVLAGLGVVFAVVGAVTPRPRPRRTDAGANARALRRAATTFAIIGALTLTIGSWMTSRKAALLREWPRVDGEVVEAAIVSERSRSRSGPSQPVYDVRVTFSYEVNGRRFVSETTTGVATSSRDRVAALLKQYSKGTRHTIYHRPDDPNVIRFDVSRLSIFATAGGLVLMGLVFLGFGLAFLKLGPKPR